MSENVVPPENAERARSDPYGGYTFNAFPADDYDGKTITYEVLRVGDHAWIFVSTGRQMPGSRGPGFRPWVTRGYAGCLVFAWENWVAWRDQLVELPNSRIAEVENPTRKQVAFYTRKRDGVNEREAEGDTV